MIRFLLKGILRDKSRSLLPIIIISIGVALTVFLSGYIRGAFDDVVDQNARLETGHVKIMTRAYEENQEQRPNDLALLGVERLTDSLQEAYPDMEWVNRIKFGGLIDVPDENGETKAQGPAAGIALDLISPNSSGEIDRMNIQSSLVTGEVPKQKGEAIIGHDFADKLGIGLGDEVTYFGSDMNGSMTFQSFRISGTIRFGAGMMDRGALLIDITDAQQMLAMDDGTGELLGYFGSGVYDHEKAAAITKAFNANYAVIEDEFAPVMLPLKKQNNLEELIDYANSMSAMFVFIFVFAMSIVLWNTGLLGGLRRYQEFGIRLALGEAKGAIYRTLVLEAVIIGMLGSIVGTIIGLAAAFYLQEVGIDISGYMQNSAMLMPSIIRAKVTPELFYIGFIPGVFAMVLGNMLAGTGIYRRETSRLFKELEV